ncbi:Bax inhibitor-1/YccA family protein [Canibacter zhoujuaniae]|uniref:Bax inhibitor-1/YccA family protein n=1 Tax=Canibacter zhoujuaniae TaxID=2708343 RepID=UPI001AB036E1|nr:Bax inhibitor-1/YccA family protein [Canibacter zhoujuaniae]
MSSPALSNNPAFSSRTLTSAELEKLYNTPAAEKTVQQDPSRPAPTAAEVLGGASDPMTIENTIQKTVGLFAILLTTAVVGWIFPAVSLPAALIALVLGLVIGFRKKISPGLIMAYAAIEGLFVGGISRIFEGAYSGIIFQALLGTLVVVAVTLILFRSGKVRTSPRMNKIVMIAILSYLAFSLINLALVWTGAMSDPWGLRGIEIFGIPLGVIIGLLAIGLAAYTLVSDFEFIANGERNRLPKIYGWQAAWGLMVTIVWIYVEILRLIAILRSQD